jgi:drug/metabolite transporter (DMT)-like permease
VIFALLNACAVALNSLAAATAARRVSVSAVLVVAAPVSLIIALIFLVVDPSPPSERGILVGVAAGLMGGCGILMSYRALSIGPVGMASAVTACVAVVVVSGVGFATEGGITFTRVGAIALCLVAMVLVTYRRHPDPIRVQAIALAFGAGVIFGLFSLLLNATEPSDGWWPVVMVRSSVVVVATGYFLFQRVSRAGHSPLPGRSLWWLLPIFAGAIDTLGNVLLIVALRRTELAVVAVVVSIIPALTAVLGRVVLKEHLTRMQVVGIAVAVLALAAIAL